MEGDEHQRRQYEQPNYPRGFIPDLRSASGSNVPDAMDPRAGPGANMSERPRQSQLTATRNPTVGSINPSATPPDLGGYGYPQGQQYATPQIQGNSLPYAPDYSQDAQRQQPFPQYTSQMMYNVSPQTQQVPYDTVAQYQPRQTAAVEVLSTQFGVPQYYTPGDTSSAPASIAQQYAPTQFQQPLQYQTPVTIPQATISSTYTPAMAGFAQSSDPNVLEPGDPDTSTYDRLHGEYQAALKRTFENTHAGRLTEAGRSLLEISEWLVGHAQELGLFHDDQTLHEGRIKLWDEFNTCWLAVLQHQKEGTQHLIDTGRSPVPPENLIEEDFLEQMGNEVIRLCDIMERHGLVDYQMGVWEEEIISVLTQCLDLLGVDDDTPEPEMGDEPSAPPQTSRRR